MSLNKEQRALQIKALFNQDTINLLTRRHRGGQSGAKGIRYEDFFAMYRLSCLAKEYLEEGKDAQIAGQVSDALVDDLEIFKESEKYQENYQLKNSHNIAWGSGAGSITTDFHNQYLLNTRCGYSSRIKLIVSDIKTVVNLQKNTPSCLEKFAVAEHFYYRETLSQLLQIDNELREAISYLCARPDQADKVETVAFSLLSAWIDSSASRGEHVKISDLISAAKQKCPFYIRLIGEHPGLKREVEDILNGIPDFTYLIERGFFSWQYLNGLDSGISLYDCLDPRFGKFQSLVLKKLPVSFDQLEGLLP